MFFYKVVITHTGGPAAFDLGLTDAFSAKLTSLTIYSAASTLTTVGGTVRSLAPADLLLTGNTLTFASGLDVDLAIGGTITVEIRANAAGAVVPGETDQQRRHHHLDQPGRRLQRGAHRQQRLQHRAHRGRRRGHRHRRPEQLRRRQRHQHRPIDRRHCPVLNKTIVASSESHTIQNRVLADFTATGFDALAGSWASQVTAQPQFVQIAGSATSSGSGTLTFGTPLDLTGHGSIGVVSRATTGNAATVLRLQVRDADGTVAQVDLTVTAAAAVSFSYYVGSLLTPTITTAGTTPGLDLSQINQIVVTGNGSSAFRMDIDSIQAIRTVVVPGEIVRYRLQVEIPEGTSPDVVLEERLPAGLQFVNDNKVRVAFVSQRHRAIIVRRGRSVPALTGTRTEPDRQRRHHRQRSEPAPESGNGLAIGETSSFDNNVSSNRTSKADAYHGGTDVFFKLGTLVNSDSDPDAEYVIVEFNALVVNDRDSHAGERIGSPGRFPANDFQLRSTPTAGRSPIPCWTLQPRTTSTTSPSSSRRSTT